MNKNDILDALNYIGVDPTDFDLKDSYFTSDYYAHHRYHGKGHLYRVMIGTALIAKELKEPWLGRLAFCAAFLHDQNRMNNGDDRNHGLRAAQRNFNLFTNIWDKYGFSSYEREYIQAACANHSSHDRHNYSSIHVVDMIVKDADALDRCRFREHGRLNPIYLAFQQESRSLINEIEEICAPTNHSFTHEIGFLQFIDAATRQGEIGSLSSESVQKYAPDNIREIAENQVFVFNNTSDGCSNAGTALAAYRYHGAVKGVAEGLTGQSYSIPTDGGLDNIRICVDRFLSFANEHPELEFLVTKIGCGVARYTEADIAPFFMEAISLDNVLLPEPFVKIIQEKLQKADSVNEKKDEYSQHEGSIKIVKGDITKLNVDVIVNAANEGLWAGDGVCGAIHKAAGPQLAAECAKIAPCNTGGAVMTNAYNMKNCKKIIHAVGPIYKNYTPDEADSLLRSAYLCAVEFARGEGYRSIAFPFISSGIFGYPRKRCAEIAFDAIMDRHCCNIDIVMCAYTEEDYNLFMDTYKELKSRR